MRAQAAGSWTCVDDAVGRVEGTAEHVEEQMAKLADEILIQAKKRNLKISPKTALVAPTMLRRRIWRRLVGIGPPGKQRATM
eukprot:2067802-Pyramimonas_sp.AAC.1